MVCKSVETTCNINNTFDPGAAKEHTLQWWPKKFCKQKKRHRCTEQTLGLCGRRQGWDVLREQH